MEKLILLGAGGLAQEVLETIEIINKHTDQQIMPMGFVHDEGEREEGVLIHGIPVLGDLSYLKKVDLNEVSFVASVGRPVWRRRMVEEVKKLGGRFSSVIHPSAHVSTYAKIGEGAIIQRLCAVMPDVNIGDFFISNSLVSIGHDTQIGDFVHINPYVSIAGGTTVGNDVFIGVKATILPSRIGDKAVIGACALVTKDVPPHVVAKGIPAKYFRMEEKEY